MKMVTAATFLQPILKQNLGFLAPYLLRDMSLKGLPMPISKMENAPSEFEKEIKRKYELLDLVNKKIYGNTKNHLAFTLKQRFDKDMQPRYYTPLRKSGRIVIN